MNKISGRDRTKMRKRCISPLMKKWGNRCAYCNIKLVSHIDSHKEPNYATIDHIEPMSSGGSHMNIKNMCVCCAKCNQHKRSKSIFELDFIDQKKLRGHIRKKLYQYNDTSTIIESSKLLVQWCDENNINIGRLAAYHIRCREIVIARNIRLLED